MQRYENKTRKNNLSVNYIFLIIVTFIITSAFYLVIDSTNLKYDNIDCESYDINEGEINCNQVLNLIQDNDGIFIISLEKTSTTIDESTISVWNANFIQEETFDDETFYTKAEFLISLDGEILRQDFNQIARGI